jgi:hypothetical protein
MKRVWKPIDLNGLRLYKVRITFPNHPLWNQEKVVAARSAASDGDLIRQTNAETIWREEPDIKGFALMVYQPEKWTE